MARKNGDVGRVNSYKPRLPKNASPKGFIKTVNTSPTPIKGEGCKTSPGRQSPSGSSHSTSPRTSPGLLAGYYAGCKFTEPPSPASLPKPPQHWMMQTQKQQRIKTIICNDRLDNQQYKDDIAQQLKVLLKVQA